jgi:hypothetical protein
MNFILLVRLGFPPCFWVALEHGRKGGDSKKDTLNLSDCALPPNKQCHGALVEREKRI